MRRSRPFLTAAAVAAIALLGACAGSVTLDPAPSDTPTPSATVDDGLLHLDPAKDYGDRYADGILPVGDERWSTTAAALGTVFLCHDTFVPDEQAGAQERGPWFVNGNTEWDRNAKVTVQGEVHWIPALSVTVDGDYRLITTNDLPDHHTGEFPVSNSDPARFFDANPNTISEQSLSYMIDAKPVPGEPSCMGGEVGVMLTGVALFNAFDAGGRDAGAWEVQDSCDGHPQGAGEYHYHSLSRCIVEIGVGTVIGFALDGFPITGPLVAEGSILTTADLDECHGIVSEIELDGEIVESYHYVMTEDFPYSASCFRGEATSPPGQEEGGQHGDDDDHHQQPPTGGQQGQRPPPPGGAP